MVRVYTKIGDVFSVMIDDCNKKYFQIVAFDLLQLNSDVIRAFGKVYPIKAKPELFEIIKDEIVFYAHCVTKVGVKMKLWEKVGNTNEIGDTASILFRDTNDYGSTIGEDPIEISQTWYVWRINDQDFTSVGKLIGDNRAAEIGVVVNPLDIVNRIKTGEYSFVYPGFE